VFNYTFFKRNKKECIKSYIDFKLFAQQKHVPFYENTRSLNALDEKLIHIKMSKSWNFEEKDCKAKDSFKKPFDKKNMFNGFKMFNFKCKSHVKETILPKNMFGSPLKLILRFYKIFCVFILKPKYSYMIIYECENSPLSHELF
jgi:hypothetical protein